MPKLIGALCVLLVVFAGALGGLAVLELVTEPEAITAAQAAQAEAEADSARAEAAAAWARTKVLQASASDLAGALAVVGYAGAAAVSVFLVGGAAVLVRWGNRRASVIYPDQRGQWPILTHTQRDGALVIADLSRGLAPVSIICEDGTVITDRTHSEAGALQLAGDVHRAAALVAATTRGQSAELQASARQLVQPEAAATFANDKSEGLRFAYVKTATNTKEQRDLADLRELIERSEAVGLARSVWLGKQFQKSGHRCTRTRYDALVSHLERAGVARDDGKGLRLVVPITEALDAFDLVQSDQESE